jgi:asparagine synthetase B (glutamine-hydrolysing)
MPILAGWLTGEQVPQDIIQQTLLTMEEILGAHGGKPARTVQPGAGLTASSDTAYAMQRNDEPPVLDWVPDRRTLVYRRPLSGLHPLYYIENWPAEGNLLFASEIKALLAVGVPRRLHLPALDALLRYGFIPAPWTIFKDIYVVPAGSILRWQHAKTIINHSTDYHLDEPLAPTYIADQLHTLLDETVAGMLPPHEQLIALTGGKSSSALSILLASQHTSAPFQVASISYKKSLSAKAWREAERIAETCQHPFLAITGVDQPEFWIATLAALEAPTVDTRPVVFHQLLHTAAAETEARIAFCGLGAHVLLGSAPQTFLQAHESQDILQRYGQQATRPSQKNGDSLWSPDVAKQLQAETWEETLHARKLARQAAKFTDPRLGWYYLDLHLRLPDFVVSMAQQLALQEHLTIRTPYLHADVIDMLTRLPLSLEDGTAKETLIKQLVLRHMPESPDAASLLPLSGPIASLQQITNSELLQQTLSTEAMQATGIFNPPVVEKLLSEKMTDANRRLLLLVFTTQLFCQIFGLSL